MKLLIKGMKNYFLFNTNSNSEKIGLVFEKNSNKDSLGYI